MQADDYNEKISRRHFKTSCMTLVQHVLILDPPYYKGAKTGLRSRFYLNCSHILYDHLRFANVLRWSSTLVSHLVCAIFHSALIE